MCSPQNYTLCAPPATGGYRGDPPLKHDPGKIPGTQTTLSPYLGKKVRGFPRRMVQRGEIPHVFFFENRRQHGLAARDLTEKLVKTGYPSFEHFLAILGQSGHPLECKVLKKSVTYPPGVSSEATWRVYFARTVSLVPKIHPPGGL